jgi:hypothetical protein
MHRQSLGREPDRAAVTGAINDRSERIGFSVRLLAIRSGACATPERSLQGQSGDNKAAVQEVRAKFQQTSLELFGADQTGVRRSRSALATTVTDDSAMAAAPMAGVSSRPKTG